MSTAGTDDEFELLVPGREVIERQLHGDGNSSTVRHTGFLLAGSQGGQAGGSSSHCGPGLRV